MADSFSGEPSTTWLSQPAGSDRLMRLNEAFWFVDPDDKRWDAPKGSVVDGASIPRPLWTLVGSPYTGAYRRASIVHDIACDRASGDVEARRAADRMFYNACRAGGCSVEEATKLYVGVRIGAGWDQVSAWSQASPPGVQARTILPPADRRVEADFQSAAERILAEGAVDDIAEIERRTDAALADIAGVDPMGPPARRSRPPPESR